MNYQVKLQQFAGPLDKLLQLIEERNLDITQVNLAEVTADFLSYVKNLEQKTAPGIVADFLVVAAKLVLIKSKILLPILELTKEEEEEIYDLEERLKIYREFKIAAGCLQKLWDKKKIVYARPLFLSLEGQKIFYPPASLKVDDLVHAIRGLAVTLRALMPEQQVVRRTVVTIEQKIEELLNRFTEAGRQSFQTLTQQKSRSEAIVLFLAVLHLLKEKIIQVEQGRHFSDIVIQKNQ